MTLKELYDQIGAVLSHDPQAGDQSAQFINYPDTIDWENTDNPQKLPTLDWENGDEFGSMTIDGITQCYDPDADENVWMLHS